MKTLVMHCWNVLDPIYFRFTRLSYLSTKNIFRVRLTAYKGKDLILPNGIHLKHNDLLVKIHLHNARLLKELIHIKSGIHKGKKIYKMVESALPEVNQYIETHPKKEKIRGIIGITVLSKGSERLGFEVVPISHPLYRLFKWVSFLPINAVFHRSRSMKEWIKKEPIYLIMSKERLNERY